MVLLAVLIISVVGLAFVTAKELVLVHVIWRHGDRTPINAFPNDKNNPPESWPQGLGELWPVGMGQMFQLGELLKKRYIDDQPYMNKTYIQNEIYVRSTDYNRTIMSGLSTIAGFYSGSGQDMDQQTGVSHWPGYWRAVPIHTIPQQQDYVVKASLKCQVVDDLEKNEVFQAPDYKKSVAEFQHLFDFLNTHKLRDNLVVNLRSVWEVDDHLRIAQRHGRKWPDIINDTIFAEIRNASDVGAMFLYKNEKIQRFRGAPLIKEIAERMLLKRTSATDKKQKWIGNLKMYAYSAHDITIMAVLDNLMGSEAPKLVKGALPGFGSALVFELWEDGNQYTVQTFYRSGPNSTSFDPVTVKDCNDGGGQSCQLDTFYNQFKDRSPKQWFDECKGQTSPPRSTPPPNPADLNTSSLGIMPAPGATWLGMLFVLRICQIWFAGGISPVNLIY